MTLHCAAMTNWLHAGMVTLVAVGAAPGQSLLEDLPGYHAYREATQQIAGLQRIEGRVSDVRWSEDGSYFTFSREGTRYVFDLDTQNQREMGDDEEDLERSPASRRRPVRGRQREREPSPDGGWIAACEDWNVVLREVDGERVLYITEDGHRKHRFGMASWVYGEELHQIDAMWWSPDSRYLAYYEFDERDVPDYFLTAGQISLRTTVLSEGYPKAGDPNPIAHLWIYDLETEVSKRIEFDDDEDEWYTYRVQFSPGGSDLVFHRTNRHQNVLHLIAADAATGEPRIILTETQETWQDNRPELRFLDDGARFIWASEASGWKHYELWNLQGEQLATLTSGKHPVDQIVHLDDSGEALYYLAYSDVHPLNRHFHRVQLDGSGDLRLTREPLMHVAAPSPCGSWFIVHGEAYDTPPRAWLIDADGREIAELARGDAGRLEEFGFTASELFQCKAADGETDLFGMVFKPKSFDPDHQYPLLVDVYGGPTSQRVRNTYQPSRAICEFGFIVAVVDNRGTPNRGKAFQSAAYLLLGTVDLDDQAAAVRSLLERPYVDATRVGIMGHSYGGYLAALAVLRYPELFQFAAAGAAVTDWRNYDTIYTERYMRTPRENPDGYDAGSCVVHADRLEGELLILHGMVDDNVHPSNAWQLIDRLQTTGKPFDMMLYPERGHSLGRHAAEYRMRWLVERMIEP